MDLREAVINRHSVRRYKKDPIADEVREALEKEIAACNEESGLRLQLICNEPGCFDSFLARYGKFSNVSNYIAAVGAKDLKDLEEKVGYYGERIVLCAQMLGLNTCWVGGTFSKGKCKAQILPGEKLLCVIAVGYGEEQGTKHKSKPLSKICSVPEAEMPVWFRNGVKAAMMAPTAVNQQNFRISLEDGEAVITAGRGIMTKVDLGIVKYHFEAVSGHKVF